MRVRPLAGALALACALTGLGALAAPPAHAACSTIHVGSPLPAGAGEEPAIGRLGLRRVWERSTGAGVPVAVVDSGVDATHPKLAGAVAMGSGAGFGQDIADGSSTAEDCENHGTPIAGIIAARPTDDDRIVGVAPNAVIEPIRIAADISTAPLGTIAAAIRAGADRAPRGVMNLSFAVSRDDPDIRAAVDYAASRDVVVVAAAGNENETAPGLKWWPAAYPSVLAVASLDQQGQPAKESNRGTWVDVAAPGVNLTAPSAGGSGYVTVTGTSFATAVVSGVAALVRERFRDLSAAQVVQRIESTAVSPSGGRDDRTGAGVVDPYLALTAVDVAAPPTDLPPDRGGRVALAPVPGGEDLLGRAGRLSTAAAGVLLTLAAIVVLAGVSARRIAARRGDPMAVERTAEVHRPLQPVPEHRLDGA